MNRVSYTFPVNNTMSFYKLIGLCILSFLVLLILFLTGLGTRLVTGEVAIGLSVTVLFGGPIALFFFRRKGATDVVTALLDEATVEIQWPRKSMVIPFSEIKSYSADYIEGDESASVESVRIRLKDGRKIRLYATDDLCDIKPIGKFRADFDVLAKKIQLEQKYFSW